MTFQYTIGSYGNITRATPINMCNVAAPMAYWVWAQAGDILTDLGAAIAGGMGLAAGANLNPERTFPSMSGKGLANPLATVWSASQMLDFLGHADEARRLLDVIEKLLVERTCLTPDLGGTATTVQVGDAVAKEVLA